VTGFFFSSALFIAPSSHRRSARQGHFNPTKQAGKLKAPPFSAPLALQSRIRDIGPVSRGDRSHKRNRNCRACLLISGVKPQTKIETIVEAASPAKSEMPETKAPSGVVHRRDCVRSQNYDHQRADPPPRSLCSVAHGQSTTRIWPDELMRRR